MARKARKKFANLTTAKSDIAKTPCLFCSKLGHWMQVDDACLRGEGWRHEEVDALDSQSRCRQTSSESAKQLGGTTLRSVKAGVRGTDGRVLSLRTETALESVKQLRKLRSDP